MKCKNCTRKVELDLTGTRYIHLTGRFRCDGEYYQLSTLENEQVVPDYFGAYLEEINLLTSDTK